MKALKIFVLAGALLALGVGAASATIAVSASQILPTAILPDSHQYTAPFGVTVQNGTTGGSTSPFGGNSPYLNIDGGFAEFYFGSTFNTLSLVWGTPDSYNKVAFYDQGTLVGTVTGSDIGSSPNNYFVTLTSSSVFNRVDFFSPTSAFEIDNVAASNVSTVPLPPSLPMFGAALIALGGFAFFKRRKVEEQPSFRSPAAV